GHNWSPFLRGAGGRGISPAIGALAPGQPEGSAILLLGLAAGRLSRRTGLGSFLSFVALVAVLARTRGLKGVATGGGIAAAILAKRVIGDQPPRRRTAFAYLNRLIFDTDPTDEPR
ncbi:MAG TPA: glycerol-3-phosphate acyltransferase, partial [Acidimicrobiales bacterium]